METRACCIGHKEEGPQSKPYIYFVIPEEQQYLTENIINFLFSHITFFQNIEVMITRENNNSLVCFRYDFLDEKLRDSFFYLIQIAIFNVINNDINEPGIYDGLFDAYKQINTNGNIEFKINNNGIRVCEQRDAYLKFTDNGILEVSEKEADFYSKVLSDKYFIKTDEITDFISINQRNYSTNTKK